MPKLATTLMLLLLGTSLTFASSELPTDVRQRLHTALEAEWGEGMVTWSIEEMPALTGFAAADRWDLELADQPRGTEIVQVVLWKDERVVRRVPMRVRVMPFAWVPVAGEPLKRGRTVGAGTIEWKREEVTSLRHDWPTQPADFAGNALRVRRSLREGDVITWHDVERAPAVGKGEPVRLTLTHGTVVIETEGTALQDGQPGDVIRIEPSDLPRLLQARVTGRGAAEVLGALGR